MRHRLPAFLTDRATIERWKDDEDENGDDDDDPFPESSTTSDGGGGWETVAEDVPCAFSTSSELVVTDAGDVTRDVIDGATFEGEVDVEEGDRLTFGRVDGAFEAVAIAETVDHRRHTVVSTSVELEDR